jgi:hypothetical protein
MAYDVAPDIKRHRRVSDGNCPVALSTGDTKVAAAGDASVVNLLMEDHPPIPAAFTPLTRQK